MRIGELSARSGVPAATIKYYVREGLLPPGSRTKANQAEYDEAHLRRLRLVRALLEVGGLSVATSRRVIAILDDPATSPLKGMGKAHRALSGDRLEPAAGPPDGDAASLARVDELLAARGWQVGAAHPARAQLAAAIATAESLGMGDALGLLDGYADAAEAVAEADLDLATAPATLDESIERMLVWTVVGDRVLTALRRLAQEAVAVRRS
ncbi:MerR family transcriptional regulator [Nonomuraea sp. NN258]|uniref:MerR family transcriptional regulator n=1 Tax=Nonomuraea antri TaxID=2730852 RepID=UPI001569882D|nr:MerR family transcriptional regulator [Nonomuraea antri]NRQ39454.1 MerR family transcriptional regulator [Nonomuraea antri]